MSNKHCTRCGFSSLEEALFCSQCGNGLHQADQDPLIGQTIAGRYYLTDRIGQGGAGTLYKAEHVTLRRRMALKLLHHQLSLNEGAVERFRREAITVCEIDNDHILQVHDFGRSEDGRLFFAMEYLEGEPLSALLESQGALPMDRAIDILSQLVDALMEAHALGYVHRDLRPRNVFLTKRRGRSDFVKLLDFGLAKLVLPDIDAAKTNMGMTFGDPQYMAPEQARGEVVDRRADIYSLGAIAFEMLTGQAPFRGAGTFDILSKVLDAPVPRVRDRRADCPEWLEAIVRVALAKAPADRFATVAQMLEALERKQPLERQPPFALQISPQKEHIAAIQQMTPISQAEPAPRVTRAYEAVRLGDASEEGAQPQAKASRRDRRPQEARAVQPPSGSPDAGLADRKAREEEARKRAELAEREAAAIESHQRTQQAEAEAKRQAEAEAKRQAEAEAKRQVEAKRRAEAEAEAKRAEAEAEAKRRAEAEAEAEAKRQVEAKRRAEAEAEAKRADAEAEAKRADAEAEAKRVEAEAEATREAEREVEQRTAQEIERRSREAAEHAKDVAARIMQQTQAKAQRPISGRETIRDVRAKNDSDAIAREAAAWEEAAQELLATVPDKDAPAPVASPSLTSEEDATRPTPLSLAVDDEETVDLRRKTPEKGAAKVSRAAATPQATGEQETDWFDRDVAAPTKTGAHPAYSENEEYEPARGQRTPALIGAIAAGAALLVLGGVVWVSKMARSPEGEAVTEAKKPIEAGPGTASSPVAAPPKEPAPPVVSPLEVPIPPPSSALPVEKSGAQAPPIPAVSAPEAPVAVKPEPPAPIKQDLVEPVKKAAPAPAAKVVAAPIPAPKAQPLPAVKKAPEPAAAPVDTKSNAAEAEALIQAGRQKLQGGDVSAAATSFARARELDPKNSESLAGLGEVAFEQGSWDDAVRHLQRAIKLARRTSYQVLLGQSLYKLGRYKEAADICRKVLKQDPTLREAQQTLDLAEKKLADATD